MSWVTGYARPEKTIALNGIVKSCHSETGTCFFVDPEMVKAGAATGLSDKADKKYPDPKYGQGVAVSFERLQPGAAYPEAPDDNVLIEVTAYWEAYTSGDNETSYRLMVTQWEPFF